MATPVSLAAIPDDGGPALPRYDGRSVLNIPASICTALGAAQTDLAPVLDPTVLPRAMLEGVTAVLLLVVDGLGSGQLDAATASDAAPTLATLAERVRHGVDDAAFASVTTVFPSSTIPALTTLSTGLSPATHGLMGWTVYLEEFGEAAELARWGPASDHHNYQDGALGRRDPAAFFGLRTLYQRLSSAGVKPFVVCPAPFRGSGLSAMIFQGADFVGYHATSSIFVLADRFLAARAATDRLYLYAYWNTLDTVSHHNGPLGAEQLEEIATLDFALGRWLRRYRRRGDLLVLITADHGHVPSDPAHTVRLHHERALLDDLRAPPTGERRMVYLHARPGRVAAVRSYCAERLASVAEWLDPGEALERGLFGPGPVSPAARRRVGDLILLARHDYQFVYPFSPGHEPTAFAGNHGALDAREMLVPLLAFRL
jgi:predicted AlkP superfamily pyrophosphatase or phosphodiesterase